MKDDRVSMHEKMDASMKAQGERISLADRRRLSFIVCVCLCGPFGAGDEDLRSGVSK